jgi:hypothetical protein
MFSSAFGQIQLSFLHGTVTSTLCNRETDSRSLHYASPPGPPAARAAPEKQSGRSGRDDKVTEAILHRHHRFAILLLANSALLPVTFGSWIIPAIAVRPTFPKGQPSVHIAALRKFA